MKEEKVNYLEQTHKKESQINEEEDHERTIIKKASIVEKV